MAITTRHNRMDYRKVRFEDKAVEVQIASFTGKGGTTEYQVLFSVTDTSLPFVNQLQDIQRAYVDVVEKELAGDAGHVDLVPNGHEDRGVAERLVRSQPQWIYAILVWRCL